MPYPTLGSFVAGVRADLGGRTDIDARISGWLLMAYRELVGGYPLETLEETSTELAVPGIDTYDYPDDCRALKAITLIDATIPTAGPIQPKKRNIQVVRRYQVGMSGAPAIWAPFGSRFILRPAPDKAYTMELDYWKKCALPSDEADAADINAVEVELPDDWFEILAQSAVEKGHRSLQEQDKAMAIHQQLFGDPSSQRKTPGIIKERLTRNAAENVLSNYGMRPRIRRYGA